MGCHRLTHKNMTFQVSCQTSSSCDLVVIFLQHIWRPHGLPDTIILNCRPQFAIDFWQQLYIRLTSVHNSFPPSTLKWMAKQNMSIQFWNNTTEALYSTNRMTGLFGSHWLNLLSITISQKPLVLFYFLPIIVAISV
jgi:hypothetical protein